MKVMLVVLLSVFQLLCLQLNVAHADQQKCLLYIEIGADVDKDIIFQNEGTLGLKKPGPWDQQISLVSDEKTQMRGILPQAMIEILKQRGYAGAASASAYVLKLNANSNKMDAAGELRYAVNVSLLNCSAGECQTIWSNYSNNAFDAASEGLQNLNIKSDEDLFAEWTKVISKSLPGCQLPK